MNKKLKSIPKFQSEAEERRFWETHDSSDYISIPLIIRGDGLMPLLPPQIFGRKTIFGEQMG